MLDRPLQCASARKAGDELRVRAARNSPPYFTAPNRLSNEFDDTTGAAPMICVASLAPSDTDGFSAGRVAARRVSGLAGSGGFTATTDFGAWGCGAGFATATAVTVRAGAKGVNRRSDGKCTRAGV